MSEKEYTTVSAMRVREHNEVKLKNGQMEAEWYRASVGKRGNSGFGRNIAVAASLVLCAIAIRTGALPVLDETTDIVLAAATDQSLLDEQLGKLSFVSSLFPETVLVFGTQNENLVLPVSIETVEHAWSETEPYLSWYTIERTVTAASEGEVIGIYHSNGNERLVKVRNDDLVCTYGNLEEVCVTIGDYVTAGDMIGILYEDEPFVMEVWKNGVCINPVQLLP